MPQKAQWIARRLPAAFRIGLEYGHVGVGDELHGGILGDAHLGANLGPRLSERVAEEAELYARIVRDAAIRAE